MPGKDYSIAVIGLWQLGETYSAGLASLGHRVVGIDSDQAVVRNLLKGKPPLEEPGLAALVKQGEKAGRLTYATDLGAAKGCDVVWITFDTPVSSSDSSDITLIIGTIRKIVPYLKDDALLVVSSQI